MVKKLCYWRTLLKGVLDIIDALLDAFYTIVWEALFQQYNAKRRIINKHANAILNINDLTIESNVKL